MPEIDPQLPKNFVASDAISVHFPRDIHPKFQHKKLKNEKTRLALHILKRISQRFASKTLQNDSYQAEKLQHHRSCATFCLFFESFRSQNVGKRSTDTALIIQ